MTVCAARPPSVLRDGLRAQYGQQALYLFRRLQSQTGQVATIIHGNQTTLMEPLSRCDNAWRSFLLVNFQSLMGVGQVELGQQIDVVNFFSAQGHGNASLWSEVLSGSLASNGGQRANVSLLPDVAFSSLMGWIFGAAAGKTDALHNKR